MALDPRIPLGVQTPQAAQFDVTKPLVTLAQLRRLQTDQQMAEAQLAEAEQKRADTQQMRDVFRQNVQTDPGTGKPTLNKLGAIGQLYQINPEVASKLEHQHLQETLAAEKSQRETKRAQMEETLKRNEIYTNVAQWVKSQGTQDAWDAAAAHLTAMDLPVPAQFKGTVYNEAALNQAIGLLQDGKERLAQALQQAQLEETQQRTRMAPLKMAEDIRQFEASQATTRRGQDVAFSGQTIAAQKLADAQRDVARAQQVQQQAREQTTDIVTDDIKDVFRQMNEAVLPTTGPAGAALSYLGGLTASGNIAELLSGIEANISFERLNNMRQASKTGAALGNVTKPELDMLRASMGSLKQSQDDTQFRRNLSRVHNLFLDTTHGKGAGPPRLPASGPPAPPRQRVPGRRGQAPAAPPAAPGAPAAGVPAPETAARRLDPATMTPADLEGLSREEKLQLLRQMEAEGR